MRMRVWCTHAAVTGQHTDMSRKCDRRYLESHTEFRTVVLHLSTVLCDTNCSSGGSSRVFTGLCLHEQYVAASAAAADFGKWSKSWI